VADALAAAEPFREELLRRGVLVITAPIFEEQQRAAGEEGSSAGSSGASTSSAGELPPLAPADLRWRATGVGLDAWRAWFAEQLALSSKATSASGLYVGLRLDGRVRSSGMGSPPWARFAMELGPITGNSMLDGFDGDMSVR
jgi:hypothetical protein